MKNILLVIFLNVLMSSVAFSEEALTGERFVMGVYYPSFKNLASRVDLEIGVNFWLENVNKTLNLQTANAKFYNDILEMRDAHQNGELDFVWAPPLLLAKHFNQTQLTDGFVGSPANGRDYGAVLLARKDKYSDKFTALKAKRLLVPENDELAKLFIDTITLKSYKRHFNQVFSDIVSKEKSSAIVLDLFFNRGDVGLVYKETYQLMLELNPEIAEQLTEIAMFSAKTPYFGYFSKSYPQQSRDKIIKTVVALNQQPRAQQILNNLRLSNLVYCSIDELVPYLDLIAEYRLVNKGVK
jgi:hypothetical protein